MALTNKQVKKFLSKLLIEKYSYFDNWSQEDYDKLKQLLKA